MTKRSKAIKNEPFSVKRALSGGYSETLIKERERLQRAMERIGNDRQRLQRRTSRLFAKANSLTRIVAQSHPELEYLRREE